MENIEKPTDCCWPLLLQDIHAFDNGGTGIVDAIQHRLKPLAHTSSFKDCQHPPLIESSCSHRTPKLTVLVDGSPSAAFPHRILRREGFADLRHRPHGFHRRGCERHVLAFTCIFSLVGHYFAPFGRERFPWGVVWFIMLVGSGVHSFA